MQRREAQEGPVWEQGSQRSLPQGKWCRECFPEGQVGRGGSWEYPIQRRSSVRTRAVEARAPG